MSVQRGEHVNLVTGAGEAAVIGHFLHHNADGTDAIQPPGGGVENVPHREPEAGTYTPGKEDLGRTWHTIRGDD